MTKRSPSQYFDASEAEHIRYLQIAKTTERSHARRRIKSRLLYPNYQTTLTGHSSAPPRTIAAWTPPNYKTMDK